MKNLCFLLGILIAIIIGLIITGIVLYVKKEKHLILCEIILIFGVIVLSVETIPYIKDIKNQEVYVITAVYDEYRTSTYSAEVILIFKSNGKSYEIISPRVFKIHVKLEPGKNYIVEYYSNTKVIKSYTLIE